MGGFALQQVMHLWPLVTLYCSYSNQLIWRQWYFACNDRDILHTRGTHVHFTLRSICVFWLFHPCDQPMPLSEWLPSTIVKLCHIAILRGSLGDYMLKRQHLVVVFLTKLYNVYCISVMFYSLHVLSLLKTDVDCIFYKMYIARKKMPSRIIVE